MDSLVAASGYKFSKADRKLGKKKLKTLSGKENETNGLKSGVASSQAPSPVLPKFDEETMANFPDGKQEALETLICKHCKKVVLKRTAKEHVALCLKSKQEKARKKKEAREAAQRAKERAERADEEDDDDDDIKGGKNNGEGDDKKSKKRKAEDDDDREPKKKKTKKEEAKAKAPKPKGPVDVEKQCGVTLPNGAQCARSLTCKSHSMGAKRAVPGRSLPYDMLLAAYQKKNQARQQKAAIDANAPALLEEDLDPTLAGPVDSDEERDAVMSAIARSLASPQPLVTAPLVPRRRNYQLIRLRETLSNAMSGNRGAGLFSVPADAGRSAVPPSATHDAFSQAISASPAPTGEDVSDTDSKAEEDVPETEQDEPADVVGPLKYEFSTTPKYKGADSEYQDETPVLTPDEDDSQNEGRSSTVTAEDNDSLLGDSGKSEVVTDSDDVVVPGRGKTIARTPIRSEVRPPTRRSQRSRRFNPRFS